MSYTVPTTADFKAYFDRDFAFGEDDPNQPKVRLVRDKDITAAFQQASIVFAEGIMASQAMYSTCYLLLAAHFLCVAAQSAASGGYGQFAWLQQSKSAGDVSESFAIPDVIKRSPFLAALCTTKYGARYAMMIAPYLIGSVSVAFGDSTP